MVPETQNSGRTSNRLTLFAVSISKKAVFFSVAFVNRPELELFHAMSFTKNFVSTAFHHSECAHIIWRLCRIWPESIAPARVDWMRTFSFYGGPSEVEDS